jgi:hypothetical protein
MRSGHTSDCALWAADSTLRIVTGEIVWQPLRLFPVWLGNRCVAIQSPPVATKSDMNGTESKIEIFKPFGEAFELMKKVLFQPFDLKKWLVIGFARLACKPQWRWWWRR